MHRMLPINRMYCSTEASQADTPNRATEGGPAKSPMRKGEQRARATGSRGGDPIWVKSEELTWGMREEGEVKQVCRPTMKKKGVRGVITVGLYRKSLEGGEGR